MQQNVSNHYRLKGRRILLGVTGGIAAYKAAELVRLLTAEGADVQVVMTAAAKEFIGGMTFQALTGHPVRDEIFDAAHEAAMGHIELAKWADLILVAPASADFLAKLAAGMADTLLHTLCLASAAPLAVAPAMNQQMWANPATQANARLLQDRGVSVWGPAEGQQACGDQGPGRLMEPAALLDEVVASQATGLFAGRKVVLTAGPTREALDPVRFLGNRSSGKMGYAVAQALLAEGAEVILVSGPVAIAAPAGVTLVGVESATQMRDAVAAHIDDADVFVAAAAVADYRPVQKEAQKIKKQAGNESLVVEFTRNPDILAEIATRTINRPFCVGFAAETQNLEQYASDKRRKKGIDMIAANLVGDQKGFEADDNALLVLWQDGQRMLPNQSKRSLATALVSLIAERIDA